MDETTKTRLDKIEERLDGLEEIGKELKEEIEGMSEEAEMTDQTSIIIRRLDEILSLLKRAKD